MHVSVCAVPSSLYSSVPQPYHSPFPAPAALQTPQLEIGTSVKSTILSDQSSSWGCAFQSFSFHQDTRFCKYLSILMLSYHILHVRHRSQDLTYINTNNPSRQELPHVTPKRAFLTHLRSCHWLGASRIWTTVLVSKPVFSIIPSSCCSPSEQNMFWNQWHRKSLFKCHHREPTVRCPWCFSPQAFDVNFWQILRGWMNG